MERTFKRLHAKAGSLLNSIAKDCRVPITVVCSTGMYAISRGKLGLGLRVEYTGFTASSLNMAWGPVCVQGHI